MTFVAKSDISLCGCKFEKWVGWNCPLYLLKWKALDVCCLENEILAYMLLSFRNKKVELVLWFKTWYVYIFGFVFGKVKVLECPLSRKWDFSLYDYIFDKYEGWACPSMSVDAKRDIWTYLVLNSVNVKYWQDLCRKKVILAYVVANLINGQVEIVPWLKTWYVNLFYFVFGKMKSFGCSLSGKWDFGLYASKFEK